MSEELVCRSYQAQLEEIASKKNTIIHLPTGSGKTFIAVCLIRKFREALQQPWGQGGKRTFFLVNTVPLVMQQKKVIEDLCPVNGVGAYSGETGVDYWDKAKWDSEMEKHEVVVMTSQILSDMLTHMYIRVQDINLLIFDECHHGVDDHPMRMVMKHFALCPPSDQPRILGLTATLLNANIKMSQLTNALKELETTFNATIATVNELGEVLPYSTNPNEMIKYYSHSAATPVTEKVIGILSETINIVMIIKLPKSNRNRDLDLAIGQKDITTNPNKIVKEVKNMLVCMTYLIEEFGNYGGLLGIIAYTILLERLKRKATSIAEEKLYDITIAGCTRARLVLRDSMVMDHGYEKIFKHSSQKVLELLNILREYNPNIMNKPGELLRINKMRLPLCAIIFTKQRFTAKVMYNLLKEVIKVNEVEFGFLKHDFIVGLQTNPMKCTREQHYITKGSHKALLMFARNELNCLISTSVLEEGVDIPHCSLVLRFDAPVEYRSYIQSKGRARSKDSNYVIMVNTENRQSFLGNYARFQQIEKQVQKTLEGSQDNRPAPTDADLQDMYDEDVLPPFITPAGARLSATSAVSLLNRYFSMLPSDQFTAITPAWILERVSDAESKEEKNKYLITIILPVACPIKEPIKGIPQSNLKNAKRSAALNTCIKLYEAGELDPISLLPKTYGVVDFDENNVKECFLNWPWEERSDERGEGVPKPGTKNCVRKHKIAFPKYLDAVPGSSTYYLHIIKLTTAFPEPTETREKALYDMIQATEGFGFLTQQPLPKLCAFPTFMTVGEVTTNIQINHATIQLNDKLLQLIKGFHYFVFDQVLAIAKKFLIFEGKVNCLYVVPVKEHQGYDIDWGIMLKHKEIPPVDQPDVTERRSIRATTDYRYKVVTPWYRGTVMPDRYIVSNVLEHLTPNSFLTSDTEETFAQYYESKYNLEVLGDKTQPLLEVRNISSRMNCLLPRAATIRTFTDKQKKLISIAYGDDRPKGANVEMFIAEFCIKYEFPGVLWYKALMLPSIIHRLGMLLVAHELIAEVAEATGYGAVVLPDRQEWLPITVHTAVAESALLSQIDEPQLPTNSIDRINQPQPSTKNENMIPKVLTMRESLYQLQRKKIEKDYPWDEVIEPMDIERNIMSTRIVDIECYDDFVNQPMVEAKNIQTRSPRRVVPVTAAIKPPQVKYVDKIAILSYRPVGRGPELRDVVSALTTINSHDIFCLERAETLGDSFLKFAATVYLYHKFDSRNEGQLTNIKGRLISNRNLYYAGERINIGGRMKVEQFSPRKDFLVPCFFTPSIVQQLIEEKEIRPTFLIGTSFSAKEALSGALEPDSVETVRSRFKDEDGMAENEPRGKAQNAMQCYLHYQAVSDKSVADCVEALIGTYLVSGGILAAVKLVEWLRIFPAKDMLTKLLTKPVPTVITENKASLRDINYLLDGCQSSIEKILNYKFKDPSFLLQAVSHASYIRNRLTHSYERLEFLGDAILDFLITSHIYENSPDLKPGELTDLRSALVNNVTFAAYVVKLGLHKYICKELNPQLDKAILQFVEHQVQRNHEIVEDVLYLIEEEECPMAEYVEVPKTLSDVFESLAGAIYLDSGGSLQAVWSVVYPIMCNEIYEFSMCIPRQPVKILYEMIHACPKFGDAVLKSPDLPGISKLSVSVTFTKQDRMMSVSGIGANKSQAKRAAAKLALKLLAT